MRSHALGVGELPLQHHQQFERGHLCLDEVAASAEPAQPAADLPLPDRLRALPHTAVQANAAAFTALHQRLVALQARLTATP